MIKKLLSLFFLTCLINSSFAQSYFQQEVNYKIDVKLDDKKHELNAFESMEYMNNSPNSLNFIYIHLWPNAYKNNSTALAKQLLENHDTKLYFSSEEERGFIDELDFKVNGKSAKLEYDPQNIDIAKLLLDEPLKSGDRILITTPFHVKIPSGEFSRLGHIGESYQITQWYPKPAVYDLNGWNPIPYLNQGEFYSEFGSFDVSITLPKNYVVGSTGDLVNGEEELEWLNNKVKQTEAISTFETSNDFPPSDTAFKTLHYHQSKVHDFAWFADKRFHVLKGEVELPHSKNKVTTWVMFTNSEPQLWKNSIAYLNDAIHYYSLWNGDYAYNQVTAIDGTITAGAGMEYPNITVIGKSQTAFELETVIMHEVGHNWFYGMLGSNERMHPWMDEGINSFYENRYIETKYPDEKLLGGLANSSIAKKFDISQYKHKSEYELAYLWNAKQNEDQPIELPAYKYTELNYEGDVYSKTSLVFTYLMSYLGEEKFDAAMQKYFETWKFKHPQPNDLREILESETGKNLSWFFDDLINSTKKLDYKIVSFEKLENNSYDITLKNTGDIAGPVPVCGIKDGKLRAIVWYDGFKGKQIVGFPAGDYDKFMIDYQERLPEINRHNNTLKTSGLFKKTEPLRLQLLGSIDNPYKSQLYYTPIVGWNNYDKFMLGLAFYNNVFPQKKFEYVIAPMYSFHNNDLAGLANVDYNFFPNKTFQNIQLGVSAQKFAYNNFYSTPSNFLKINPYINFEFKKKDLRSPVKQVISIRSVNIYQDQFLYDPSVNEDVKHSFGNHYTVNELNYKLTNSRTVNPFNFILDFQNWDKMVKSSITANYSITLKGRNKSIDFRLFAGTFLANFSPTVFGFKMSSMGYQDYLYDDIFLGRSEGSGILSQQLLPVDGAFKVFIPVLSYPKKWLTAMNIKASLPGRLPLRLYADIGASQKDPFLNQTILFDAGVNVSIVRNIFEIYFPVVMSKGIKDEINKYPYGQSIRFELNLNSLNPFKAIKNLSSAL